MNGVGELLQVVRRAQGLTQEDLAARAQVTQAALSRYEHDLRTPEPDVMDRLAAALGITPSLLTRSTRIEGGLAVGAHMRRRATARPGAWRELEAQLNMVRLHASRLMDEVMVRADLHVPAFDPIDIPPSSAARMVRAQWRLPVGPVHSVATWLDAAGVIVVEQDFGSSRVDGLSQWSDSTAVILLNSALPTDRKRLTLAHELGHLALHSSYADEDVEGQANEFAAEFLMPAIEIAPMLRQRLTLERLVNLKRHWGVSMQSLIERAHGLGTLTSTQRSTLYKALSARGIRSHEPVSGELVPEVPRLTQHISESLTKRGLSATEIAEIAGYASAEANTLLPMPSQQPQHLQLV
ncbi:helix-turn-helix domain-containing protein [Ruania zhangjianzhongii]|uniref:helix-turn-helix domain-containing protein n=1 Tax=Ruania zhangjianzhongii TaxID=2603206 RepID=UPI0011CAB438|nr:XRE family transcriptional regulator [Ruania zhangjianzhongii]